MTDEVRLPPSGPGTVVLDLGGSVGALMVHVGAELGGAEIEITPLDPSSGSAHTHTEVRERRLGALTIHSAVFPSLEAGDYLLDDPRGGPPQPVSIRGGEVTQLDWRP